MEKTLSPCIYSRWFDRSQWQWHCTGYCRQKSGNIVEDTVGLNFYHDYYEDGSPKLTEGVKSAQGIFYHTASKIGILVIVLIFCLKMK